MRSALNFIKRVLLSALIIFAPLLIMTIVGWARHLVGDEALEWLELTVSIQMYWPLFIGALYMFVQFLKLYKEVKEHRSAAKRGIESGKTKKRRRKK